MKGDYMKRLLLLFVMICIFYLSNTPELRVIDPNTWFNEPSYEENVSDLSFIKEKESNFYSSYNREDMLTTDFILHKVSHIIFYSLFTFLLHININIKKMKYVFVWFLVVLFAFTDEMHQYFIIGRSGRLNDVILDSSASFLTLFFIFIITLWKNKKSEKRVKMEPNRVEKKQVNV